MIDDAQIEYLVKFFDGGSLKRLKTQLANADKAIAKFEQRTKDANGEVVKLLNLQELASKQGFSSNVKIDRVGNQLIAGGGAEAERKAAIDRGIIAKRNVQEAERILKLSKDARLRLNSHYTELEKQQAVALTTLTRQEFANREVLNLKQAQVKLEAAKLRAGQAARAFANAPNGQGPVRNTASVNLANSQLDVAAAEKQVAAMKQVEAASKRVAAQQVKINSALDRANILRRDGNTIGARKEIQNARIAKAKAFELNQERLTSAELRQQVRLNESIARAKARASKATNPLDSLNRRLEDGGAGLLKIQAQLLANYAAMGLAFSALAFAGRFVVELDKEFAQLQAITATTDESMGKLEKTVISVSEGVKFTALEVAEAATIMGQAGFSVNQITSSIGDITLLATAVGTDLKTAVDLVTSTISVFNLRAEEAGTIANVFTTAVNNSKLNLEKLTLGLQYAGNIANEQNITFSELTATLGAMANSGIRSGSTLGTGLRQILTALAAPSEKLTTRLTQLGLSTDDVNVKLHGLTGVLSNLQEAGFTTSDALQVLEVRAGAAYAALTNRSSTIEDLRQEFLFSSAAAEANSVQMEALANKGARLQSVFGTVVAKGFEPLLDVTKGATDLLSTMLSVLNRLGPVLPILVTLLTSYTVAVVANRVAITALNLAGQKQRAEMLKAATAARIAQGGYKGLLGAMGPVGLGLAALTTAFALAKLGIDFFTTSTDELKSKFDEASSKLTAYEDNMRSLDKEIEILSKRHFEARKSMQEVNNIAFELQQKFADLGSQFQLTGGDASKLIPELQRLKNELREIESIDLGASLNALSELQLKQNKESAFTNKFSSRSVDSLINQVGFNTKRFTRDGAREQFGLPSSITSLNDKDNLANADITTLLKAQQDLNKVKAKGLKLQQEFAGKEIKFLDTEAKQVKYFVDQYLEQVSRIEDRLSLTLDGKTKERSLENRAQINAFQQTPVFIQLETKIPALDAEIQEAKNDGNLDELRPIFIKAIDKIAEQLTTNELFERTSLSSDLEAIRSDLEKSTEETKGELKAREALALAVTKSKEVQLRELKRTTTIDNSVSEISANRAKALELFDAQSKAELSSLQAKLKKDNVSGPTITKTLGAKEKELAEQRVALQNKFSRLVLERENKVRDDYLSNLTSSFERRIELQKALVDRDNSVAEIEAARKEAFRLQGEKEIHERQQLANKYFNDESARILNNAELNVKFKTERQALNRAFSSITNDIEDKQAPNLSNALKELTKTFTDAQKVLEQRLKDLENPVRDAQTARRSFDARSNRGRFGSVSRDLADRDIEDARIEALESQIKLLGETSRSEIAEQRQKLQDFEAVLLGRISTLQDRINDPNTSVAQIDADKKELVQLESQKLNVESELEGVELLDTQTLEQAKDKLREISEITGQGAPAARSWSQAWSEGLDAYIQKLDEATISSDNFADTVLEVGSLATDSLGEAFFDIATGAKSVGEAFGDMAEAILKAILKILAEQAAIFAIKQIFGVFGFTPQTFSGGGAIRGFSGGGRIPNLGVTGRDHVPIMAEAGEFMLRKSAVDSIGKDKLYAMNALGSAALRPDTVQSIAIPEGKSQEVKVYVMAPEEKPQLGPEDILHVIGQDIATGGQTKQLIKHAMN